MKHITKRSACLMIAASALVLLPFFLGISRAAQIVSFSPEGTVKEVRQVKAIFSEPMTAIGDKRENIPFDILCSEKGYPRWVDGITWIYDFIDELPGGCRCSFEAKRDLKSLSGSVLTGRSRFSFSTGGPVIVKSIPESGNSSIENSQIFVLELNAEADEASIISNAWFSIKGIGEKVGVSVIKGKDRTAVLNYVHYKGKDKKVIILQARRTFPDMTQVSLVWGAGIKSLSGVAGEKDQVLNFSTKEPFKASFSCSKENPNSPCVPLSPMELDFTSDFPDRYKNEITLKGTDGRVFKAEKFNDFIYFYGPFTPNTEYLLDLPKTMMDNEGRRLANASKFPMRIKTGGMPALAKFSSRFGILEKADAVLPLTVRNIETSTATSQSQARRNYAGLRIRYLNIPTDNDSMMIEWLKRTAQAKREQSVFSKNSPAMDIPVDFKGNQTDFRVVGIPLKNQGLNIVEIESRILGSYLLGKSSPLYVPTAALVTNLGVHFKKGRENSLVWVTALDTGKPVGGASVSLRDCRGGLLWQGETDALGIAMINKGLPGWQDMPNCECSINYRESSHALNGICGGIFVFARKGGDVSFTHTSWDEGIEPWRFQLSEVDYSESQLITVHTVFDRPLFRPGETVHMKHFIRKRSVSGFKMPLPSELPDEIAVTHSGTYQQYRLPLNWSMSGTAETEWKIPEGARLGGYEIILGKKETKAQANESEQQYESSWISGNFKIGEFKVPIMKATLQGPAGHLIRPQEAIFDITLSYLSGGPASGRQVKLRSELRDRTVYPKGYEYFAFNAGPIKTGIQEEDVDFGYGDFSNQYYSPYNRGAVKLKTKEFALDLNGCSRVVIDSLPVSSSYKTLHSEFEYLDPNGEVQTVSNNMAVYPSSRLIGISSDDWNQKQDRFKYKIAVLDLNEKPVAGQNVTVDIYQEITSTHRVRMVGGYYGYQNVREIKHIGRLNEGVTDSRGMIRFTGNSPVSGSVILYASAKDGKGDIASSSTTLWLAGREDLWFEQSNDDRMDVLPEKREYEPGDKAEIQVRMPFRSATALVTSEREGIIDARVVELSGKDPVVDFPVKPEYAPNVFVSVLAVRGRIAGTKPTSSFDPGKPSYKLGICEMRVGLKAFELKVDVQPEKTVCKIRDNVNVRIEVKSALTGKPVNAGEVTLAAVDEGLLELMPNDSWDILSAMMVMRPYCVDTSTAQSMVVGRRHFGLKAVPHGGGGGRQLTRELFDTLLIWKGTLKLNAAGEASINIPLNDSLTSFRVVAVAASGLNLFGTGSTTIRTSQDIMLLSGLPQIAREGDRFKAGFTVRNAAQRIMDADLQLNIGCNGSNRVLKPVKRTLQPGQAAEVSWQMEVPKTAERIEYTVTAKERGGDASDRMKIVQKIMPAIPVKTIQATLMRANPSFDVDVSKPDEAIAGKGGIKIEFRPSITASLAGVKDYMASYSYPCLEQKVSVAVALDDRTRWDEIVRRLPSYIDKDYLLKYFPCNDCKGSDVLSSYVLSVAAQAGYEIPGYLREQLVAGLKAFAEGRVSRKEAFPAADLTIRKIAAFDAISMYENLDPQILSSIRIDPNMWPSSTVIKWIDLLGRINWTEKDMRLKDGEQILRARMVLTGTQMNIASDPSENLWWLMITGDLNASQAIIALLDRKEWQDDLPKMAIGLTSRMKQGHWDTTSANAWGALAVRAFSGKYERQPVDGTTTAKLGSQSSSIDWKDKAGGGDLSFPLPSGRQKLKLSHNGSGSPWALVQLLAAVASKRPEYAGFELRKTVVPIEQKIKGRYSKGDIIRIRLEVDSVSDMTWVVLNDPVPAGATIIKPDLGGTMLIPTEGLYAGALEAFTENAADSFKRYYEYVPKGHFSAEYSIRLNCGGIFNMPPTRVEALYSPDMFGEVPNNVMEIKD